MGQQTGKSLSLQHQLFPQSVPSQSFLEDLLSAAIVGSFLIEVGQSSAVSAHHCSPSSVSGQQSAQSLQHQPFPQSSPSQSFLEDLLSAAIVGSFLIEVGQSSST